MRENVSHAMLMLLSVEILRPYQIVYTTVLTLLYHHSSYRAGRSRR